MAVIDYLEDIFAPVYGNDIPIVKSPNAFQMARVIAMAAKAGEEIFVYGDYDMDGFCCQKMWDPVLRLAGAKRVHHFLYGDRTHEIDTNIIQQVKRSGCRLVIICDTGFSDRDKMTKIMLENEGATLAVIDHHLYADDYQQESERRLIFNTTEETAYLNNEEVSGCYACLLVAKIMCEKFLDMPLPYEARVCALASMYADGVSLSSTLGRALYNNVALGRAPGPDFIAEMNKYTYMMGRRLMSYIVAPQINACFRSENFVPLNQILIAKDRPEVANAVARVSQAREQGTKLKEILPSLFEIRTDLNSSILLAIHEETPETQMLKVNNYTGLVAQQLASKYKCAVVAVVHRNGRYRGSFRDFNQRPLQSKFKLFMFAQGHPPAFGVEFISLDKTMKHLEILSGMIKDDETIKEIRLSGGLFTTMADVRAAALYNEYRNTEGLVYIQHKLDYPKLIRGTKYTNVYDVGLPQNVVSKTSLYPGQTIIVEPCVCKDVELRCVQ